MKTMYKVRVRKFEKKNWKVVAEYETEREAHRAAAKIERANRNTEDMYDHVDVKYPDGSRFVFA